MVQAIKEQKYDIDQFVKFLPGDRVKCDVSKGRNFNIVVICLDDGYELPPPRTLYRKNFGFANCTIVHYCNLPHLMIKCPLA